MIRCIKCGLPETHETIQFGSDGVCNICAQVAVKRNELDWPSKKLELDALIEAARGRAQYDCIIPFSGGKDSTFTLLYLVKEYGIKPLVVRFNHAFMRTGVNQNLERTYRKLGVDVLDFQPNWKLVRRLMLQSLIDKGDFCWHCHTGVFSYPMWVAVEKRVPLVIWGEPSAEYTAYFGYDEPEEVDEKRFNRFVNLGISAEDMHLRLGGEFDERDFLPYSYPPAERLQELGLRSICLGSFVPWNTAAQGQMIHDELGWEGDEVENVPSAYWYEKIECQMQGVRDYLKFIKRGYSRPTHLAALDVRHNRLDSYRDAAFVTEFEGRRPPSLDVFLELLGLSEAEFLEIATSHEVSPHHFDVDSVKQGVPTHDFASWSREGAMPRTETLKVLHDNGACRGCRSGCGAGG